MLSLIHAAAFAGLLHGAAAELRRDAHGHPLPPYALARLGAFGFIHNGPSALSPDGKTLVTVTDDLLWGSARVRFHDVATGRTLREIDEAGQSINGLLYSPDGKFLAVNDGRGVRLWRTADGIRVADLRHPDPVDLLAFSRVTFSPDGKRIATLSTHQGKIRVRIWDPMTGKKIRDFPIPEEYPLAVAFTADGKGLAVTSYTFRQQWSGYYALWDVKGRPIAEYRTTLIPKYLSADGRRVVLWTDEIRVADVASGKEVRRIPAKAHGPGAVWLAISPDGRTLATRSPEANAVSLWDLEGGKDVKQFARHFGDACEAVAFSRDGRVLQTRESVGDNLVLSRLWDVRSGQELGPGGGHHGPIPALAFTPDGKTVISGGADGTVRVWDGASGRELRRVGTFQGGITALAMRPDGRVLAVADWARDVTLWDPATGRLLGKARANPRAKGAPVRWLRFEAGGEELVGEVAGCVVTTWAVPKMKILREITCPWESVRQVQPLPDGSTFAVLTDPRLHPPGKTVAFWNAVARAESRALHFGQDECSIDHCLGIAVSPDGNLLVTGEQVANSRASRIPLLRVWETASGRCVATEYPPVEPQLISFSPDGRTVAVAGMYLGTARSVIIDLHRGRAWPVECGHAGRIEQIAFSGDGRTLAVAGRDGTVTLWAAAALRPQVRAPATLMVAQLEASWKALAGEDAAAAWAAIYRLADMPEQAVPFLRERLKPATERDPKRLTRLIADLDDRRFAVRQKATADLEARGGDAVPALLEALRGEVTLEAQRRVEGLLERALKLPPPPERLRELRAVAALERCGTAEAREALESLARGAPQARLTEAARLAAERLRLRAGQR